jgi:carbonic anhydrase
VTLEVANHASLGFIPIIKVLPLITDYNSKVVINQKFILLENFLPFRKDFFYRYEGSQTTPPCYETVTWIVFGQHIKISPLMVF